MEKCIEFGAACIILEIHCTEMLLVNVSVHKLLAVCKHWLAFVVSIGCHILFVVL